VILAGGFIFWKDITGLVVKGQQTENPEKTRKKKGEQKGGEEPSPAINVSQKWELPAELKEVSGIAYLSEDRFACIQDEQGIIYIYNTSSKQIEKQIPFTGPGDFEDIALVGTTAWVVRADGRLFEVDMNGKAVKEHTTPLTVEQNIEGLTYDRKNNRLLITVKDEEPGGKSYKGIYAFDLAKKTMAAEPVSKIDVNNQIFQSTGEKKRKIVKPSAIGIHPTTADLYIADGPNSRLLIMDSAGTIKNLLQLGKSFEQPEGIAFGPQGEIFISNEGNKSPANILQISVEEGLK
jgi:uncharacterized protein YjiK